MLRKILLICSLCLFINILQAKSLDNFLAEYDYQKLKLVNTNQEFATPYLIGKVNQNKAYVLTLRKRL